MIPAEYYERAMLSLRRVLVETRSMAHDGASSERIAEVLDWAELLPTHLLSEPDRTEQFRNVLTALVNTERRFRHVVATFDGPRPSPRPRKVTTA